MFESSFPSAQGTYLLIMQLPDRVDLRVGRLGAFSFEVGWYVYVGSAFGAGGLRGRLKHHLAPSREKRLHWHIDYLTQAASIQEIWYCATPTAYEHLWASLLTSLPDVVIPLPHFGSSDCSCLSHLFYFEACPSYEVFVGLLGFGINDFLLARCRL